MKAVTAVALVTVILVLIVTPIATHAQPVITRVSGCVDSGAVTTQCAFPLSLTLHGTGFLQSIENEKYATSYISVSVQHTHWVMDTDNNCETHSTSVNDTLLVCDLIPALGGYNSDTMLTVTITVNGTASQPYQGLSIAPQSMPVITAITGCNASGCVPGTDVLTLHGTGFGSLLGVSVNVRIGPYVTIETWGHLSVTPLFNATTISLLTLTSMVWRTNIAQSLYGSTLAITITDRRTNTVVTSANAISLLPLPPPVSADGANLYLGVIPEYNFACGVDYDHDAYVNCYPGISKLSIKGQYLYDVSISIGGVPVIVDPIAQTSESIDFALPVYPFANNTYYWVNVSNGRGWFLGDSAVTFVSYPTISWLVACNNGGFMDPRSMRCLGGETLSIYGTNFVTDPSVSMTVRFYFNGYRDTMYECYNASLISATLVTCTVPPPPTAINGSFVNVYLWIEYSDHSVSNTRKFYSLYDWTDAPRITGVRGCETGSRYTSSLTLTQCQGGNIITIIGQRLSRYDSYQMALQSADLEMQSVIDTIVPCQKLLVVNDSAATCQLPYVESSALLDYYQPLKLYMWLNYSDPRGIRTPMVSNAVLLTIIETSDTPADPGASSSDSVSTSIIVLAAVFGATGLVLVAAMIGYVCHRRARTPSASKTDGSRNYTMELSSNSVSQLGSTNQYRV